MSDGVLADREKALEDLFFEKQNRKLIEKLRAQRENAEAREGLARITGLDDEPLLDKLVSLDLRAESWAALALIPLVEVAWADGHVDEKERRAVLGAAEANGLGQGSTSHQLLEHWLAERPNTGYLEAWGAWTVDICAQLDAAQRAAMQREVLERARRVAEAAGGILGLGNKVGPEEQRVLDALAKAFDP